MVPLASPDRRLFTNIELIRDHPEYAIHGFPSQ